MHPGNEGQAEDQFFRKKLTDDRNEFMRLNDFDVDEPLTFDAVAEIVGARRSLVARLAQQGLIETIDSKTEVLLPRRAIVQLRRMQRLHRDLGVNFAGAAIILDLVRRIEQLNRELAEMQGRFGE
jgi:chaperone modulatory protein CbpM